ncbi:class I SAM-dependent methyltransferase [Larkinella sp. VNQ87]|uniref:class I SAM-dependent methyltransferase n=1 Tax=Larkinella sp. VNQ87 TaxID=3400921 RepID=UPI003C0BF7DF
MLRIAFLLILWLTASLAHAQVVVNECLDKHYTKRENCEWLLKTYRNLYNFRKTEQIASVGAGSGAREVIYSMMDDSLTLYVQDVDPVCLQPEALSLTIRQLYQLMGRTCSAMFIPVRGVEKETRLPERFFDKIIIENSLHEFTHPNEMLDNIRRNLKPNGRLFIGELIARRPGRKHQGCRKPLFTEESLVQLLETSGFRMVNKTVLDARYPDDRVYEFAL